MTQTVPPPLVADDLSEEALFPEARQLRRRRWTIRSLIVALVCVIAGLVIAILNTGGAGSHRATGFAGGAPPAGALTTLHLAGALAVAHNGDLYVADTPDDQANFQKLNADRVLVRLPDGRFRLVASNLPYISDLAVAPDGTLYIADAGWVREVGRNGVIRTIAGDGRAPPFNRRTGPQPIPAGTRALAAPLGSIRSIGHGDSPLQIAIGPGGQLYISNGVQVLRLTPEGTLDPIKATVAPAYGLPGGRLNGIGQIAVAPNGTIYVGGLMRGWSLWAIDPAGTARYLTYARQNGGNTVDVQPGPHGNVYTASGDGILLINHGNPRVVFDFKHNITGQYFELTNFAITSNGVIYADEIPGGYGFEAHQQLVAVRTQHVTLLWQETNRAHGKWVPR
jgi:hypothetical protein